MMPLYVLQLFFVSVFQFKSYLKFIIKKIFFKFS